MLVLSDPCLRMPELTKSYVWSYNAHLGLLSVYPKLNTLTKPAQKLWEAFLKTHDNRLDNEANTFIYHPDSIVGLINCLRPKLTWLCLDVALINTIQGQDVYTSPTPEHWLAHPLSKKHVWLLWQKIFDKLA